MAKFAIECPHCGRVNTASTFVFAKKVINCGICHQEINVKQSRLVSRICPNEKCKSVFVFDQGKPREDCPVCGTKITRYAVKDEKDELVQVTCPQCSCHVEVSGKTEWFNCPVCDLKVDGVQKIIARQKLVKDNAISVIKYEGDNSTFVWKHPIEDFNFGSQLIVHESQEAIFFLNGQALDSFGPGRYSLETGNLPILKNAYKLPTDGQDLFHAEVYFINKTVHMALKWGTDSRVRFIDPVTSIPLDIGASGELNLQVDNGRKFLLKLVGTTGGITNKEVLTANSNVSGEAHKTLQSYFRAPLMTAIKSHLATAIKEQNINILEIDQHMATLSDALKEKVSPELEEYGLTIPQFYITNIALPEDDKNFQSIKSLIAQAYLAVKQEEVKASVAEAEQKRRIIEAQTQAQLDIIKAQGQAEASKLAGLAEAEVMHAKGYNQKDVLQADVQKAYAEGIGNMGGGSNGGGNLASDLIGLVAGMKVAGGVMDSIGNVVSDGMAPEVKAPVQMADTWECSCGEKGNVKNFCMNCGAAKPELWDCECGNKGIRGKFCPECGKPKAVAWDCPACGSKNNKGKFCSECGAAKLSDENKDTWDCQCGNKGITGKFCSECGHKKGDE